MQERKSWRLRQRAGHTGDFVLVQLNGIGFEIGPVIVLPHGATMDELLAKAIESGFEIGDIIEVA